MAAFGVESYDQLQCERDQIGDCNMSEVNGLEPVRRNGQKFAQQALAFLFFDVVLIFPPESSASNSPNKASNPQQRRQEEESRRATGRALPGRSLLLVDERIYCNGIQYAKLAFLFLCRQRFRFSSSCQSHYSWTMSVTRTSEKRLIKDPMVRRSKGNRVRFPVRRCESTL